MINEDCRRKMYTDVLPEWVGQLIDSHKMVKWLGFFNLVLPELCSEMDFFCSHNVLEHEQKWYHMQYNGLKSVIVHGIYCCVASLL